MHENNGYECNCQVGLALSGFTLSPTEYLDYIDYGPCVQYLIYDSHLPGLSDTNEDIEIHVDKAKEGKNTCCQGWVPDQ